MPINNHMTMNATKKRKSRVVDWDDPKFLAQVYDLAYEGFHDTEIADDLNINRSTFRTAKETYPGLSDTLRQARADARTEGVPEMPSLAMFRRVWATCDGRRSNLMKKFKIGWSTLQRWIADEPGFADIIAERDLAFLEQTDIAGRILALGGVKGKDQFPGWSRYPDSWMMRFYLNTLGKKYGYGETPVMEEMENARVPDIEDGVDIESWILQEMTAKKNIEESTANGKEESDDTES